MTAQFLAGAAERTHCRPAWGQVVGGQQHRLGLWKLETGGWGLYKAGRAVPRALDGAWSLLLKCVCGGVLPTDWERGLPACRDRQGVGAQAWGPLAPGEGGRRAEWPWT